MGGALLAPVVPKAGNAIHWINLYPVDNAIGFPDTCPLDNDLSSEKRYTMFELPEPGPQWVINFNFGMYFPSSYS